MAQQAPVQHNDDVADWVNRIKTTLNDTQTITAPRPGMTPWTSSFFGCLSPIDTCFITCCCPCVTFGKTHHRLRKDANLTGYSPINVSCLGFWASSYFCLHWVPLLLQRHDINERNHLESDIATDCLKAWCCGCCDLVQQDKEAAYHLAHGGSTVPVAAAQPAMQEEMKMPEPAPANA